MLKRDFLTLQDYSRDEILALIRLTEDMKKNSRKYQGIASGKVMLLIFQKPSTRTRVSLETAMAHLGGYSIFLMESHAQLSRGETVEDTARVVGRYVDIIAARVFEQEFVETLAKYSSKPVINALSDKFHPCQVLSDLFTILEHKGKLEDLKLAYVGDGNNVCNSLLIGCSKVGMDIAVASPKGYEPPSDVVRMALENAKESGSKVEILNDPMTAVKDADVIYTDTWVSMGQEAEAEVRIKVFKPYQVNAELLSHAPDDVVVMHCLPAHRGYEITDDVMDGPKSIIFDQAENRLHSGKAIIAYLLGLVRLP